ncbi:MAG: hypothetical protein HC809_10815 [Gammaproteobacteria bacterium]|nr:hypothetical protein [Gammaproteobacteria bacterium]
MGSLFVIVVVAICATIWVRSTRAARSRWVSRLNLPGTWECEDDGTRIVLELSGGLAEGRYVERSAAQDERGEWRLHGDVIEFASGTDVETCDLRPFEDGSLGIDGPRRRRRIYHDEQVTWCR